MIFVLTIPHLTGMIIIFRETPERRNQLKFPALWSFSGLKRLKKKFENIFFKFRQTFFLISQGFKSKKSKKALPVLAPRQTKFKAFLYFVDA